MALYLVIHTPMAADQTAVRQPSRLVELARKMNERQSSPRWLKTWSPDVHDDRIFSLWDAENGAEIQAVLTTYGFLDDMESVPLRVKEWGPADVLAAEESSV